MPQTNACNWPDVHTINTKILSLLAAIAYFSCLSQFYAHLADDNRAKMKNPLSSNTQFPGMCEIIRGSNRHTQTYIHIYEHIYIFIYTECNCHDVDDDNGESDATAAYGGRLTDAYTRKLEDFQTLRTSSSTFMPHIHMHI